MLFVNHSRVSVSRDVILTISIQYLLTIRSTVYLPRDILMTNQTTVSVLLDKLSINHITVTMSHNILLFYLRIRVQVISLEKLIWCNLSALITALRSLAPIIRAPALGLSEFFPLSCYNFDIYNTTHIYVRILCLITNYYCKYYPLANACKICGIFLT